MSLGLLTFLEFVPPEKKKKKKKKKKVISNLSDSVSAVSYVLAS